MLAMPAKIKGRLLRQASQIHPKWMKNRMFFETSILKDFRVILGEVWEAKIIDFRIFGVDFSMQIDMKSKIWVSIFYK